MMETEKSSWHFTQVEELRQTEELAESSSNNLEKDTSPGQENRPAAAHNVMNPALPASKPKADHSKMDASQAAALMRSCKQEMQLGKQDIQRQLPLVSLQDLTARSATRTALNKTEVITDLNLALSLHFCCHFATTWQYLLDVLDVLTDSISKPVQYDHPRITLDYYLELLKVCVKKAQWSLKEPQTCIYGSSPLQNPCSSEYTSLGCQQCLPREVPVQGTAAKQSSGLTVAGRATSQKGSLHAIAVMPGSALAAIDVLLGDIAAPRHRQMTLPTCRWQSALLAVICPSRT